MCGMNTRDYVYEGELNRWENWVKWGCGSEREGQNEMVRIVWVCVRERERKREREKGKNIVEGL